MQNMYCMNSFIWNVRKDKFGEESRSVAAWGWGLEQGLAASGVKGTVWNDGNVLLIKEDNDYGYMSLYRY